MKIFKWRIFIITATVCLLPILLGLSLWERLPESIAIPFDIYGNPDNFTSKPLAVFGLPLMMAAFQAFCCFVNDINAYKKGENVKLTRISKWIIPTITVVLYVVTLGVAMGWDIDVRRVAMLIVGAMFLVLGNFLPKLGYIKNYNIDTQKARKINRFIGYQMVIMGILFLISIFFAPITSILCLVLLIPVVLTGVIYVIKTAKK